MNEDCYNTIDEQIIDTIDNFTGRHEWHAVYTINLGELCETGVFDWTRPELDWSSAAYDPEQYERVCAYFIKRFYWREISLLPVLQWMNMLQCKLVYELMPKYKPMYARIADGIDPLAENDEYYKRRTIDSAYPETLLSGNADYISNGTDEEWERIKDGDISQAFNASADSMRSVDQAMLDELDSLFTCMYSTNVNGL